MNLYAQKALAKEADKATPNTAKTVEVFIRDEAMTLEERLDFPDEARLSYCNRSESDSFIEDEVRDVEQIVYKTKRLVINTTNK